MIRRLPGSAWTIVLAAVILIIGVSPGGRAGATAGQMFMSTGRETLKGLPGVEVVVEPPEPDVERAGLTRAAIRQDVVSVLQAGGIRIYSSQAENPSPAKPYLYVLVTTLTLPGQAGLAVGVQVHLRQSLRSTVTDSNIVNAMTWDAHNVFGVSRGELALVRGEIQALVKLFVQDWTKVH